MNGEEDDQIEEPAMQEDCPECRGKGTYALLITIRPCEACGGTGKIAAKADDVADDPESNAEPVTWVTTYTYDKDGELVDKVEA